jgi:beta-lactam-binding protein with PASTA domain
MSFKEFILSKLFFKHLGLAIIITVSVILILLIWLNIYTRHGQARPVPDFFGLTVDEAQILARKSKLRFTVIDSVYTSVVPRGAVAEQNPKAGFKVKKWRNVSLTINSFRPEMVAVPDLIDLPLRQANALIESSGLVMGKKSYKPYLSIDVVLGQLYKGQEVMPGDSLQKGSVIDLVLGKGLSNQTTTVPDLIGMLLDPAVDRINGSSLNLGTLIFDNSISNAKDSLAAFVYDQYPEYSEEEPIRFGSSIVLWLTVDSLKLPSDSTLIFTGDTLPPPAINN